MERKLETICIQGGWKAKKGEPQQLPIYQSTTFRYETSEQMARLFDLEDEGYFYTRLANPTNDAVARKIAEDRPEVKAARDAAAKHKAEADALIKYIIRKDKPATRKRVEGMTERIQRLRQEYNDIVSEEEVMGYELLLRKTVEEAGK